MNFHRYSVRIHELEVAEEEGDPGGLTVICLDDNSAARQSYKNSRINFNSAQVYSQ